MQRLFQPVDVVVGEDIGAAQGGGVIPFRSARVVGPADIEHDRRIGSDRVAHAFDMGAVRLLMKPEVHPAELEGGVAGFLEAGGLFGGLDAVLAEKSRGISAHLGVGRATEQIANRLAIGLALDIPECDIDTGDGVQHGAATAHVDGGLVHLAPEPLDVERILADQHFLEADHHRMGAGRVDNRLGDVGRGFRLTDAGDPFIGVDEHHGHVLGAIGDFRNARNLQIGDFDISDFHPVCSFLLACQHLRHSTGASGCASVGNERKRKRAVRGCMARERSATGGWRRAGAGSNGSTSIVVGCAPAESAGDYTSSVRCDTSSETRKSPHDGIDDPA